MNNPIKTYRVQVYFVTQVYINVEQWPDFTDGELRDMTKLLALQQARKEYGSDYDEVEVLEIEEV